MPTPAAQPALIVVTGRPGSGKTTLAHALARTIHCPAICRDEIKEGCINTIGHIDTPGDGTAMRVYDAFFDTVTLLLERGVTLVAEAAFQHKLWAPKLQPLRDIARIRIIVCALDELLAQQRHAERSAADPDRDRFHQKWPGGEYDPPQLDVPTLMVDTSDKYRPDFQSIVSFARA
jgi:predicted kinase